jgi:hypothetical protein
MLTALCYDLVGGAYRKSNLTRQWADIGRCFLAVAVILRLIWGAIADFFRSRAYLQTEIIALRHQLNVMRRKRPEWLVFCNTDRLLFVWMYRLAPDTLNALSIVKPETVKQTHPNCAGLGLCPGRAAVEWAGTALCLVPVHH